MLSRGRAAVRELPSGACVWARATHPPAPRCFFFKGRARDAAVRRTMVTTPAAPATTRLRLPPAPLNDLLRRRLSGSSSRLNAKSAARASRKSSGSGGEPGQTSSSAPRFLPGSSITLTDGEKQVFAYLLDVVKTSNLNSELRVAGGWVRDKLLAAKGKLPTNTANSVDLDIALNNMMGKDFAFYIMRYNKENQLPQSKIGYVRLNPAKSKHLETATTTIYGHAVDFVNLRTESYGRDSRIPTIVGLGSPEQDSRRRDFTINALYYNIKEDRIEDYTGQGIADLEAGVLRTPVEPLATLLEDPLRVLRGIRFKSTFSLQLDSGLFDAMQQPEVKIALLEKISRQRVGVEINKMLQLDGERTHDALEQVWAMDLQDVIFPIPPYLPLSGLSDTDQARTHSFQDVSGASLGLTASWQPQHKAAAHCCLHEFSTSIKEAPAQQVGSFALPGVPAGNGVGLLSAFLLPVFLDPSTAVSLSRSHDEEATAQYLIKTRKIADDLFKQALSLSNNHAKAVFELYKATVRLLPLLHAMEGVPHTGSNLLLQFRVELGHWLRAVDGALSHDSWETAVRLAFITRNQLLKRTNSSNPVLSGATTFIQAVKATGLHALSEIPPLLSGQEIMETLQIRPGTEVGKVKTKLISWQLEQFGTPSKEEALAFIKTLGTSPLATQ